MKPAELTDFLVYLRDAGMTAGDLSELHHFAEKGRKVSFASCITYFQKHETMRARNALFAIRCKYVAEQRRQKNVPFSSLVVAALLRYPVEISR